MNTITTIYKIIKNIIKFANNHKYISAFIIFMGSAPISFLIRILKNSSKLVMFISGVVTSIATFFVGDPSDFILSSFTFVKDNLKNGYNSIVEFVVNKLKSSSPTPEEKPITLKDLSDKIKFTNSKPEEPQSVFESLRKKYKSLTINGHKVDDSWLEGYYLYFTLFLITSGAIFLVTICYMDETGVVKETVMKFTGLGALHGFLFGRNNDDDPGDGLLPPLPGQDQEEEVDPNLQGRPRRGWNRLMRKVIRDNSNTTPYPINTEREEVKWRILGLFGSKTEETNIDSRLSEDYAEDGNTVELNNMQSTVQSNNLASTQPSNEDNRGTGEAGPSNLNTSNFTEGNSLGLTNRRNSFDDIPKQPTPFAESEPLPYTKGKNVELSRHFKNTSVDEGNLEAQANRYFNLKVEEGEESDEEE
jgi:hypothetical protein